jgi:hypothetical protein
VQGLSRATRFVYVAGVNSCLVLNESIDFFADDKLRHETSKGLAVAVCRRVIAPAQ